MKTVLLFSNIILFVLIAVLVFTVIGIPLMMTCTTSDRSPSFVFFVDNLIEFLLFAPFILLLIFPAFALKSYAEFKLDNIPTPTLKKHIYILSALEIITAILLVVILISINSSNSVSLL